jgi:type I restriction enzyme S subunit
MIPMIQERGNGATFKEVSKTVVYEIPIFYPTSLGEQKRIALILDKAEDIRRKQEQVIALGKNLLTSCFLEMFGDPVVNCENWPVERLDALCTKITDGTHDTPPRQDSGFLFITGKNIRPFRIDLEKTEYVSEEVHRQIYRRCNPEYGDVLYTNIGANTGTAAFNVFDFEFSMKNVALLKPKKETLCGRYLEFLLNHTGFKARLLSKFGLGGAQGFLGLKSIKGIEIPVPDYQRQKRFEELVGRKTAINTKSYEHHRFAQQLSKSIVARAFRGEL